MQDTTETRTLSVSINRDLAEAYAFLSVPENFPKWASGLGELRRVDDAWIVQTPDGPVEVCFSQRNDFGVLDHWVCPAPDTTIYIPMRVVRNGSGCELIFTLFRLPGMSDEKFAADAEWVMRDLHAVRDILETKDA
ncbi:SRPBCC family protein [Salinisphaera aquimarina]|uniref:SRPBCC family protein n=1 Tax=Salinisphaera aquimarina TaxID=2094031 RepID=A0ABV7EPJ7_9GAMM